MTRKHTTLLPPSLHRLVMEPRTLADTGMKSDRVNNRVSKTVPVSRVHEGGKRTGKVLLRDSPQRRLESTYGSDGQNANL